jgi:hypothetical protein
MKARFGEVHQLFAPSLNGRNRRILAVDARSGDGPFTIQFADLHHRAMQTGGLVSWRFAPRQAA